MRLITCTAIAAALVLSTAACTQQEKAAGNEAGRPPKLAGDLTALNGTWKTDKASVKFEGKPDDILLQDGTYKCSTCIPPLDGPRRRSIPRRCGPRLFGQHVGQGR